MNIESSNFSIKADTLYFIVAGEKNIIDNLANIINNYNNSNKKIFFEKYISTKISIPIACKSIELMKQINNIDNDDMLNSYTQKPILIEDGIEFAQGHIYAEGYTDNHYILQVLTDNDDHCLLGFVKFMLCEDIDPEKIIEDWFKKYLGKIPNGIKKNTKLVTVTGAKSNILVITTEIKKL
jgi:hypothetical protein